MIDLLKQSWAITKTTKKINIMKVISQQDLQQEALSLSIEINMINKDIKKLQAKRDRRKIKLRDVLNMAFNQVQMEFE